MIQDYIDRMKQTQSNHTRCFEINRELYTICSDQNSDYSIIWKGGPDKVVPHNERIDIDGIPDAKLWDIMDKEPNKFALFTKEYMGKEITVNMFVQAWDALPREQTLAMANDLGIEVEDSPYDTAAISQISKEPAEVTDNRTHRHQTLEQRLRQTAKRMEEEKQNRGPLKTNPNRARISSHLID
ncbi:MAG: hypothetical protein J6N70_06490 [Oribacterium sp.]|nr:hypothetical protein [Oribacterium sp.]